MDILRRIRDAAASNFALLSGDDGTCVEFCAKGGDGVIGVASHFIGREMGEFIARAKGGDATADAEYKQKYNELFKHLYIEANPIGVKMVLYWLGVISTPDLRLPLVPLDEKFPQGL